MYLTFSTCKTLWYTVSDSEDDYNFYRYLSESDSDGDQVVC
jgi:hypothetical protein